MYKVWGKVIAVLSLTALLFFLCYVFLGKLILPQVLHLGPITIHYYGIIMAAAVAAGFYLATNRAAVFGIEKKTAEDLIFWIIIGGFLGARIYHIFSAFDYYAENPGEIIKIWNGGLAIYGAIIGGLSAVLFFSARYTLSALRLLDWLAPSLILGQIIGRFGNMFNYEAFGYPTDLPWKMFVPVEFRPVAFSEFTFFHPWFLYEAFGNLVIFILLLKYPKAKTGSLFFSYLLLYNVLRFGLEFLRIDNTLVGQFRLSAIVSLILILAAVSFFVSTKYAKKS